MGSGCGKVDRADASKTRLPGFKSDHRQILLTPYLRLTAEKSKIKKTRP